MIALSDEQRAAHDSVRSFLTNRNRRTFVLHGLAGTGKTTVLATIARSMPDSFFLCALTGKAASVLQRKTGINACTIHSVFYQLLDKKREVNGAHVLHWGRSFHDGALDGETVLLDECSMVDDMMARDILRSGARIVACGDPGQLQPVSGRAYFDQPDHELTTIHRQALESPIVRQAHRVRGGGTYEADGDAFRITRRATDDDVRECDAILCWTNKTRHAANREARRVRGLWMPHPQAGEPVMCLRNNPEYGIYNGAVYTLAESFIEGATTMRLDIDGRITAVRGATFETMKAPVGTDEDTATPFTYGYAMTVHKAQGSEFPNVLLLDEYRRPDDRARWLYTAITRAADRILVMHG